MTHPQTFGGKYRIKSNRLSGYDYTSGDYFVTIVVQGADDFRPHSFGEIIDGMMTLSELGKIAEYELLQTGIKRSYISIPSYVIMPDHVHFIVHIDDMHTGRDALHASHGGYDICNDKNDILNGLIEPTSNVNNQSKSNIINQQKGDACNASLQNNSSNNHFGPQSHNLASIIRGFKSAVTSYARNHIIPFKWQTNYYEHIIRDEREMYRIMLYIENNPKNRGKEY